MTKNEFTKLAIKAGVGVVLSFTGELLIGVFAEGIIAKIKKRIPKTKDTPMSDLTIGEYTALQKAIVEDVWKKEGSKNEN